MSMKLPFKDKHLEELKRVILNGARSTWTIEENFRQELIEWARQEDGESKTKTTRLPSKPKKL